MTTISLLYNNIRGGRVFKSGKFVMTASALGFMMAVSAEAGSCLEQSTGSGNFTCSGAAVTTDSTQNLVTTASQIDVSVENGFGLSTVAQNGINISAGNKNISYLDNTGSSITAERNGLIFSTSGSIDVETNGDITVTSRDSINLNSGAAGNVASLSLVSTGDLSGTRSILTRNQGNGTSDVTIGGDLTINSGGNGHVLTRNDGGDQTFTLQEGSSMTGGTFGALVLHGVNNTGAPFGNATGDTTVVLDGDIDVDYYALWLNSSPTTDSVYISGSGDFSTESIGILVENQGTGETVFSNTGQITSNSDTAITISNTTNASGDISVSVNDVSGEVSAVTVNNRGAGNVNVTAAGSLTSGQNGPGTIYINNESGSDVTIDLLSGSSVSGNYAIYETDGDAVVNIASGATVNGNVSLGAGNDTLNLLDYDNTNILDGGTDTNTISLGGTSSLDGVNLLNWQAVSLLPTSDISLTNLSIPSFALGASCGGTTEISGNSTLSSVQGCEGEEEIRISDNSNIDTVEGAGGSDIIDVSGNSRIQVLSGGGDGQDMSSSLDDADVLSVAGNAFVDMITGDLGDDTINVSGGYVSQIYGDTDHALAVGGHDSLNISGGMVNLALMMDGNDTINVTDGSIADVQMGNGDDAGSWSGGNLTSYSGGDGSDSLVISSAVDMSASTIDGGDDASSADGMIDTLTISGTSAQVNGNNITNWEVLGFDDGADVIIRSLSIESINASCGGDTELTTGVVTGSVNGCVGDEGIIISGDASVGIIEAAGGADTITLLDDAHVTSLNSGGDGQDGSAAQDAGDTLILASGTVDNDVMTELGNDTVNLSGTDIGGLLNTGAGADEVSMYDGSVNSIMTESGDDNVSLSGGSVDTDVLTGDGADSVVLNGIEMSGIVDTGADEDAVIISGGSVSEIITADGADVASVSGGIIGTLNMGTDNDTVNLSGGSVSELISGQGDDSIVMTDGDVENLNSGEGGDVLVLAGGSLTDVTSGDGADNIFLNGSSLSGSLISDGGNDSISVLSGSVTSVDTGSDDDFISLVGGDVGTMSAGAGDDSLSWEVGSVNNIDMGAGNDHGSVSHNNIGTAVINGGDDTDTLNISGTDFSVDASDVLNWEVITFAPSSTVSVISLVAPTVQASCGGNTTLTDGSSVSEFNGCGESDTMSLLNGSEAGVINGLGGDDDISVISSTAGDINSDEGDDQIMIDRGVVETVSSGTGSDDISISFSTVSDVDTGEGADSVVATGSVIDVINTGADEDTVLISGSTVSDLSSGDGDDSVTVAGISDVSSLESGSGNDEIALTGGVVKSVDAGSGDDALILSGSDVVNINMGAGNDGVTVNSGSAQVILTGSGDDSVSWNDGEVGTLSMGAGSDSLIVDNSNQSVSGVVLDGGDDMSTADGMIDRLTLRNGGAVDGSDLLNWELVELSGGDFTNAGPAINAGDNTMGTGLLIRDASFDMGDSAVINGDLLLADTGLLIATGSGSGVYDVNGRFSAKGTVNMSDGQAGDVINVTGDYVLGGTVISDVDLTRGNADMISISGDAVGLGPSVVDLNLIGAADGELSIDLITVDGKTDTSDFVLSDDIFGGAYDYSLSLDGGTWSLGRDYLTQVAVYETIPSLIGATIGAETYHQRVGNRTWFSQSDAEGVWMKVYGENSSVTPDSSTEVTSYDLNSSSIQIGADKLLMETEHGTLIGGAVLSYDRASVETGDLSAEVDGYGVMATLTYADISGAYVDAQLKVSNGSMDIYGVNGVDTSARMFSVEGGRKFETGHGWTVTPQAQITFASVDFDDFTGQDGEVVSDEDGESTNLRVGASAQRGWENANGDFGTFYMTGNLHKTIDGYVSVDVSGSEIRMSNDGLSAEVGIGGSYTWDKGRSTIYGEVSGYKGISGSDLSGAKANVGLRIRF